MSIGKKLFELRKQKGISQEELAVDLNISQSSISNYELEITKPDVETLQKLSMYYKIPIEDLLSEDGYVFYNSNNKNKGDINNLIINHLSEKLIEQYEQNINRLQKENERLLLLIEKLSLR
jgi:transcriptional regulator with XRE-family HTH domain